MGICPFGEQPCLTDCALYDDSGEEESRCSIKTLAAVARRSQKKPAWRRMMRATLKFDDGIPSNLSTELKRRIINVDEEDNELLIGAIHSATEDKYGVSLKTPTKDSPNIKVPRASLINAHVLGKREGFKPKPTEELEE